MSNRKAIDGTQFAPIMHAIANMSAAKMHPHAAKCETEGANEFSVILPKQSRVTC
jgi:hypothetical protein